MVLSLCHLPQRRVGEHGRVAGDKFRTLVPMALMRAREGESHPDEAEPDRKTGTERNNEVELETESEYWP